MTTENALPHKWSMTCMQLKEKYKIQLERDDETNTQIRSITEDTW